jgi:ribosomal protein L7/L12
MTSLNLPKLIAAAVLIIGAWLAYWNHLDTITNLDTDTTMEDAPATVSVTLSSAGNRKAEVIEIVREATGLGRQEAQDLIDNLSNPVKTGLSSSEAEALKHRLEQAGARVELQ